MCGRVTMTYNLRELYAMYGVREYLGEELPNRPRFNVAPSQSIPIVRNNEKGERELAAASWGIIPRWAKSADEGPRAINARNEKIDTHGIWGPLVRKQRCIVPVSGFFEWKNNEGTKVPHYITAADGKPLSMAGLWEVWTRGGERVETVAIITTGANALMAPIHNRMPVILDDAGVEAWLAPEAPGEKALPDLLRGCPPERLRAYPVSRLVNSPANDTPACIEEVAEPPGQLKMF